MQIQPSTAQWSTDQLAVAADRLYAALRRGRARLAGDTLSPARIGLLEPLLDTPQLGVGQLAELAGVAVPTATRQLQQLDQAGVVARHRDPDDDRRVLVTLTGAGRARLTAVRRTLRQYQTSAYSTLTARERDDLGAAITRLTDLIERTIAAI
jgi:DNA-binding MarR family transcriptional regulator